MILLLLDSAEIPSSFWVRIRACSVWSGALDIEDINDRRACDARANGLSARLEHHVISQRRRVEVHKFALRSAGVDDVAVRLGSYFAVILADPVNVPRDLRPRATHGDVVIRHDAAVARVDIEPARKIIPDRGVAAPRAFGCCTANVNGGYTPGR